MSHKSIVFTFIMACASFIFLFMTSCTDPGIVRRISSSVDNCEDQRICDICNVSQPRGTEHCEDCQNCIEGIDAYIEYIYISLVK